MLNSPKRSFFKAKVAAKSVTMAVMGRQQAQDAPEGHASVSDCEVTEYDDERGWNEWQDSVFVQEFESQIDETIPMSLTPAPAPKTGN